MTFNVIDRMVGLSVVNAVDGKVIGVSTRLIFDKKRLEFKYVLVEGSEEGRLLYLQYPDILRMNEKAILCLTDENSFVSNYVYYNDPDAFVFVGDEAVDEDGKLIGTIVSAELDEDAKIVSFTVRRGKSRVVFGIDRLMDITKNGVIIVHRTEEDVFVADEPVRKKTKSEDEKSNASAVYRKETDEEPKKKETAPSADVKKELKESAADPTAAFDHEIKAKEKSGIKSQRAQTDEASSKGKTLEEKPDFGARKPRQAEEKEKGKEKGKGKEVKASGKGIDLLENFKTLDTVGVLRYALLAAFFAACIILGS